MDFESVIKSINIVEYISQYVELTQKGQEWWGLSCFKDEETPSFSVREDPPFFYDYSSGIGGNLFNFVKAYNKCSNQEAVDIILAYAGVTSNSSISTSNSSMRTSMDCKKYKKKSGYQKDYERVYLDDNYMDRYLIRDDKLDVWREEGISDESLQKFQVKYDTYTNSLVYPIRDITGSIVNIGARTLNPNWKKLGLRKYSYFQKWGQLDVIYGLFENLDEIKKKKEIILFEGCKSVLIANTWGIKNCGALLTSHLNPRQMKLLISLGVKVVFALDKEIDIRNDKNIKVLKNYVNVSYLKDVSDLIEEKDSPVDKGKDVFLKLYETRYKYR